MPRSRHEIPTHLNVEDKAFFGLSVRQVMFLTIGLSGAYGLWNQWVDLLLPFRLGAATLVFVAAAAVALLRPGGRGLEDWAFVAVHYVAIPHRSAWRTREPELAEWRPVGTEWEELTPRLAWKGESE